jgi:hypothetical protein
MSEAVANLFFIMTHDLHLAGFLVHIEGNTGWGFNPHGMRVTHVKDKSLPIHFTAVTHTINFKNALETLVDSKNHIINNCAGCTMQSALGGGIGIPGDGNLPVFQRDANQR